MGWKGKDPYEGMRPEATLGASFSQRLSVWLGTGLGIGLVAPCAPGTFGSLPGVLLAWGFAAWVPWQLQILLCVVLTLLAVPVCTISERTLKKKDDGRITADEWMLYP
ncbi:MAG: phosphatidylglycerophosphatase A, partial [Kiritimatiellae bacterium]|nr:phosphatidylglycerophosphatase A [Kiritimatiellia bacterium]